MRSRFSGLLVIFLLLQPVWAQEDLHGREVRFRHLDGGEPPTAFHSLEETQAPRQPVTAAEWEQFLAGRKARLRVRGNLVVAELESGKQVWFPDSGYEDLRSQGLPPPREKNDWWWNDLLDEYEKRALLLWLRDDTAVEMTFLVAYSTDSVRWALPRVLSRKGMFVEEQAEHWGVAQIQTDFVQEETPGFLNPPYRRYRFLINLNPVQEGCEINVRATVTSWQKYQNSDLHGWRPDESPGIRQRIRQAVAEVLTLLTFPERWEEKLEDYEAGLSLGSVGHSPATRHSSGGTGLVVRARERRRLL